MAHKVTLTKPTLVVALKGQQQNPNTLNLVWLAMDQFGSNEQKKVHHAADFQLAL